MRAPTFFRHARSAGGLAALVILGACTDSTPTSSSVMADAKLAPPAALVLTATDVIVPGADQGAFTNPIVANESGYATTEFWDNPSDDGANCNVGFWASGTFGATCENAAPGSDANQGGYTRYWGNGPEDRETSSFMFNGAYGYRVTLLASYAGEASEIGWFTVSDGVYTFHKVDGWDTKTIGTFALVPPGTDWGFYMKHEGHVGTAGCAEDTDCSDATRDMHEAGTTPVQQFALFTNADESKFLVGIEDNEQVGVIGDDDFQDFILSVEPFGGMFVIGDVEDHGIDDTVNFWGAQWWKNNTMSGVVSNGYESFKGYAVAAGNCGDTWTSLPGNSSNPPATIPENVLIIVTTTVLKSGSDISGDIQQILIVHQDGGYGPSPGHAGNGPVTEIVCTRE